MRTEGSCRYGLGAKLHPQGQALGLAKRSERGSILIQHYAYWPTADVLIAEVFTLLESVLEKRDL